MAAQAQASPLPQSTWRRALPLLIVLGALLLAPAMMQALRIDVSRFPAEWNLGLRQPIDAFQSWVIGNRATHPLFVYFFEPLSDFIDAGLVWVEDLLLAAPWIGVIAIFSLLGYLLSGARLALLCGLGLWLMGAFGLWAPGMQTLALMTLAVVFSLAVGIPLGILAAFSDRFDRFLRPILDAMQTMPAFVYLIPVVLFFGVARVPAVVATVIYAIPPAIRLTALGIRQVSPPAIEAARAFGSTRLQLLFKVQLPLALPALMTGVNQTIMMALSIVVIAALVGAGGLGREVLLALQRLQVGKALEAGLAIVFLAVILDRLSEGLSKIDLSAPPRRLSHVLPRWIPACWEAAIIATRAALRRIAEAPAAAIGRVLSLRAKSPIATEATHAALRRRAGLINSVLLISMLFVLDASIFHFGTFPENWRVPLRQPADAAVAWMRDNLYEHSLGTITIGDWNAEIKVGTRPISDFLTLRVLDSVRALLRDVLPWPTVILLTMALAYFAGGRRLALISGAGLLFIGLLGMWELSMDTLSQVLVATAVTMLIALPLGVWASQSDRAQRALRPVLDFLQTIPSFVFLVPVIMLFNIGRVAGLIASVLYAVAPGVRLTDLGIRQVAAEAVEAAHAFGSTRRQTLFKVQLPMALPAIMLGINQMIMAVLAMVIIAGLVGGAGLGLEVVSGLANNQTGQGLEAGLAIVVLAIVIDRITQAWANRR
jgi:glycine betaine/proline transport system permease protein